MSAFVRVCVVLSLFAGASAAAEPPVISDAWARATPPSARTAAAYLTITSVGAADRLIGVTSPAADTVEIHTHVRDGGLQRMVRLEDLTLPAGDAVQLEPGGLHLMLLGIAAPLEPGMKITVSLRFAAAGPIDVEVPVVDARAGGPANRPHR